MNNKVILQLSFDLSIGEVNLNEIVHCLKEIQNKVFLEILEAILLAYEKEIVERLTGKYFPEDRKGLGFHPRKDAPEGRTCGGRKVNKRGFRNKPRQIKTIFGTLQLRPQDVECRTCGKRYYPLFSALGLEKYCRKEGNFEREVNEAVIDTNYRRLIEGLSVDISLGGVHNIVVESDIDKEFDSEIETKDLCGILGDGTGLKQYRGQKGELRVVVGVNKKGRVVPIGNWVNTPWKEIQGELKERLKNNKNEKLSFVFDGEKGMEEFLEEVDIKTTRCNWHGSRGLYHALWKEGLKKTDSQAYQDQLAEIIGVEVPESDYELLKEEDKDLVKNQYHKSKEELSDLISFFEERGYKHATSYLRSLARNIWTHVEIWLESGIISPRTTSLLERTFREMGRRLKKIAWGWSDKAAVNLSKMIILKQYAREKWEEYWKKKLGIKGAFQVKFDSVKIT